MDPLVAAVTLGVAPDASRVDVQKAFRQMVRDAHPDTNPMSTADLDLLAEARDTLLAPGADTMPGATTGHGVGTPRSRPPSRPVAASGRGAFGYLWGLVVAVGAAVLVAAVVVAVLALTTSNGSGGDSGSEPTACVLIGASGAGPVSCTEQGAQEVVAEYSGARLCDSDTNTLVVGATTWCLRPVE